MKSGSILVAACGVLVVTDVHADSVFNVNLGNWHNAGNWTPLGVPDADTSAFIGSQSGQEAVISSADAFVRWLQIGQQFGTTGTLNISNGRKLTAVAPNDGAGVVLGAQGVGNLFVSGGGQMDVGQLILGDALNSNQYTGHGTAIFTGNGTRGDFRLLDVGGRGRGDMLIADGAVVEVTTFGTRVGQGTPAGFSSTLSVSGAGSQFITSSLSVGVQGSGILSIENGGRVTAGSVYLGLLGENQVGDLVFPEGVGLLSISGTEGARGQLDAPFIQKGNWWGDPIGSGTITFDGGVFFNTAAGEIIRNFQTGDVQIAAGGAYFDGSANGTIGIGLQGVGGLTKIGNHTLQLAGANTYQGQTDVLAGRLLVDGSLQGAGTVNVQSGGTLAGNGFITGDVVVGPSGRIAAGGTPTNEAPGQLFLQGDMEWQGFSTYRWAINNAAGQMGTSDGWSHIHLDGALNITADADNPFTINIRTLSAANAFGPISNWDPNIDQQWTILTALGGINGFDPAAAVMFDFNFFAVNEDIGGFFWLSTLEIPSGPASGGETRLILHYTVPSPGSLGLLALAGLAATRRRRAG